LQFLGRRQGEAGAGHAERVTKRDRAAVWVYLGGVIGETKFAQHGQRLRSKRLVQFDDENASEPVEDDEGEEEENLSDASQYAQSAYTQEMTSGPLTIIPLNKNTPETSISEYTTTRKKRKLESEDDPFHRRSLQGNSKLPQKMVSHNNLSSCLSSKPTLSHDCNREPSLILRVIRAYPRSCLSSM
jgi:hypothetical protein